MTVVVSDQEVGPCRRQLTVEVPAPAVAAETDRVTREVRRTAALPGFRKGHVPVDVVRRRYWDRIESEVLERLIPRYWHQAEAEASLDALVPPEIEGAELRPGEPLTFVATVEVRPEVKLGELEGFDLPDLDPEPTSAEIAEALESLRREAADWVPVERPAGDGDQVTAALVEIKEGEATAAPQTVELEVGDPNVWEELSAAVRGKAAGQKLDFERRGEGAVAVRRFEGTVQAVKQRDLPPLDDELARRVGKFESLEELEREIRARIRRSKSDEREHRRERALLDQLRERHPMPLPERVVEHEIRRLLEEYATGLAARGVDPRGAGIDWEATREQARPQAERRVHAKLLLDAIARHKGIEVSEEEFQQVLVGLAKARETTAPALRQALDRDGRLGALREQVRRDKTLRVLLGEDPAAVESAEEADGGE